MVAVWSDPIMKVQKQVGGRAVTPVAMAILGDMTTDLLGRLVARAIHCRGRRTESFFHLFTLKEPNLASPSVQFLGSDGHDDCGVWGCNGRAYADYMQKSSDSSASSEFLLLLSLEDVQAAIRGVFIGELPKIALSQVDTPRPITAIMAGGKKLVFDPHRVGAITHKLVPIPGCGHVRFNLQAATALATVLEYICAEHTGF